MSTIATSSDKNDASVNTFLTFKTKGFSNNVTSRMLYESRRSYS